jgi:hypothetical protein
VPHGVLSVASAPKRRNNRCISRRSVSASTVSAFLGIADAS